MELCSPAGKRGILGRGLSSPELKVQQRMDLIAAPGSCGRWELGKKHPTPEDGKLGAGRMMLR